MITMTKEEILRLNGEEKDALQWYEPRAKEGFIPSWIDKSLISAIMQSRPFIGASAYIRDVQVIAEDERGRTVRYVPSSEALGIQMREIIRIYYPQSFETLEIVTVHQIRRDDAWTIRAIGPELAMESGVSLTGYYEASSRAR